MKNRIEFVKGRLSKQIFAAENNGFANLGRVLRFALFYKLTDEQWVQICDEFESANPGEILPKNI